MIVDELSSTIVEIKERGLTACERRGIDLKSTIVEIKERGLTTPRARKTYSIYNSRN